MTAKTLPLAKLAQYLGVSRPTLYKMLDDGRFPVPSIPGTNPRRWNIEDVDAWRNVSNTRASEH